MLKLRTSQLRVLEEAQSRRFAEDLTIDIAKSIPSLAAELTPHEISQHCLQALNTGRSLGLSKRPDLYGFIVLGFMLGADFHQSREVRRALTSPDVSEGRRALVVFAALRSALEKQGAV